MACSRQAPRPCMCVCLCVCVRASACVCVCFYVCLCNSVSVCMSMCACSLGGRVCARGLGKSLESAHQHVRLLQQGRERGMDLHASEETAKGSHGGGTTPR